MTLPADIYQLFLKVLLGEMSIPDFEQWLYADKRLEHILSDEDYLDLIAYGYQNSHTHYELFKLLSKHIDKGELETKRIHRMLTKALHKDKATPEILLSFYDLYCKGYSFLDNLGLCYGLQVAAPGINQYADSWNDLDAKEQNTILNSFYPELEIELKKVISWMDTGKIVLTGVRDEDGRPEFTDYRTDIEMGLSELPGLTYNSPVRKPWWKFW